MKKWIWLPAALVSILVPVILVLSSIRILIHPVFLEYEYNLRIFLLMNLALPPLIANYGETITGIPD